MKIKKMRAAVQQQFLLFMDRKGGKLQLINKGSNSEIYFYGSSQKGVVLKVVSSLCSKQARHLANEYTILKQLEHKNIVRSLKYQQNISLHGTGQNKQLRCVRNVLVMENAKHGNLLNFYQQRKPTLMEVRWIFGQVCEGVRYLHGNSIAHRDLKLQNILITQYNSKIQIKLADFGFATSIKNEQAKLGNTVKGTRKGYMAPEIHSLLTNPHKPYEIAKTDIFALGVILFTMVLGRLPFEYATPQDQHYKLLSEGNYEQFWKSHGSHLLRAEHEETAMVEDFKLLFQSMTDIQPSNRPSIEQVCKDAWLQASQREIMLSKCQVDYQ